MAKRDPSSPDYKGDMLCRDLAPHRGNGHGRQSLPQKYPSEYAAGQARIAKELGPLALDRLEAILKSGADRDAVAAARLVLERFVPAERPDTETESTRPQQIIQLVLGGAPRNGQQPQTPSSPPEWRVLPPKDVPAS